MNWFQYFVEAWGVIVILYAKLLTDADPIVLAVATFACLLLAKGITTSYFSPLSGIASYMLGHMTLEDLTYNLLAQIAGTLIVIITYLPLQTLVV